MQIGDLTACILAGGLGTRLQSVVKDIPKPMAPIDGRPFLEYLVFHLKRSGIKHFFFLTGYKSDTIESYFGDGSRFDINITYSRENKPLGTGGAIKLASPMIQQDRLLLVNGDTFFPFDVSILLNEHCRNNAPLSIALKMLHDTSRYGSVSIDENYRITGFHEKAALPNEGYINAGAYIIEKSLLEKIPEKQKVSLETEVFPGLANALGIPFADQFIDIGIPEDYLLADKNLPSWEKVRKSKAVFIDRDGVINDDPGYPHLPEHIVFKPYIFDFCRNLQKAGYLLVVVTNQAGIAKGKFTYDQVVSLHRWMKEQFSEHDIDINDFVFCPYHDKGIIPEYSRSSLFRKPQPGMILDAAQKWNIDLTKSIMIGDKNSDRIRLPYLKSYIIKSHYTEAGYDFETLAECERKILNK